MLWGTAALDSTGTYKRRGTSMQGQPQMSEAELSAAIKWAAFWESVEQWAFLAVVFALAIEFGALKLAKPYKEKIEHAREVQVLALKVELAKLIAPRALTQETQQRVLDAATPFAGLKYDASVFPDDAEALAYLEQIELILETAGWTELSWSGEPPGLERAGRTSIGTRAQVGVRVEVAFSETDANPALAAASEALAKSLDHNGIEAVAGTGNAGSTNKNVVHIIVGKKPPR